MKIEIIIEGKETIEAELTPIQHKADVFTLETPDYLIEVTQYADKAFVSNAMDGYGINQRKYFENAQVIFHS